MTPTVPAPAMYKDVPALVLGATGFIGRWVARALSEAGARVTVVGRNQGATEEMMHELGIRAAVLSSDLTLPGRLRDVIVRAQPSVVFNLTGYGVDTTERDADASQALNADLPPALAEAMAECVVGDWTGQQVVHAGSALEYGTASGDLAEDTKCTPTTLYGRTKLAGTLRLHETARTLGVRATTGRLFTVFGPGEHDGRLLPSLLAGSRDGDMIRLSAGMQQRDFTFVDDVVDGLLALGALAGEHTGVVNIATGELTTVRRFVEIATRVAGIASERLAFGALPARAEEMNHDPVNVARLHTLTGWSPSTSIEDGVRRTLTLLSS